MKFKSILRAFMLVAAISSIAVSCKEDGPGESGSGNGTITGTVSDDLGNPIEAVSVSISDLEATAVTDAEGKYTISNVPIQTMTVTFEKEGYQTSTATVTASRFNSENTATVNATLSNANAVVTGKVLDGANGNVPFAGVTVTLTGGSATAETTSGEDGTYSFGNLTIRDYTLTFSMDGYVSSTATVTTSMFDNDAATATVGDITLLKTRLLPGLTLEQIREADKWYYNEYRGGTGGTEYPRWDWSTAFMGALNYYGVHDEISEGSDIKVAGDNGNVDLTNYTSYVWGSKSITEDNKIMTVRARTFADRDGATVWSASVIDLSAATPSMVQLGENITSENTDYEDYHFDLSEYIGKEIVIAVGVYCSQANQEKHLAIKRINFTAEEMTGWDWIKGTAVPDLGEDWHLTQEMIRSTMVNESTSFSGITTYADTNDRLHAYQSWRENNHVCFGWGFMALTKDTEIFAGQGAIIKTRGGDGVVNTLVPESYFYAKFNIGANNDQITLRIRNGFGRSEDTFFKLTAITEDMEVTHLQPVDYTVSDPERFHASAAEDANGCWRFFNDDGEADTPEKYATFTYDLSSYNGKNVVLALGVYKGEKNDAESKICIHSIELN